MVKYELTIIIDGKSTPAKKKKVSESMEKLMEAFDGKAKLAKDWGKKDLAYNIGKIDSGIFLIFDLELDTAKVPQISSKLNMESDIVRYLLIRKGNK